MTVHCSGYVALLGPTLSDQAVLVVYCRETEHTLIQQPSQNSAQQQQQICCFLARVNVEYSVVKQSGTPLLLQKHTREGSDNIGDRGFGLITEISRNLLRQER